MASFAGALSPRTISHDCEEDQSPQVNSWRIMRVVRGEIGETLCPIRKVQVKIRLRLYHLPSYGLVVLLPSKLDS
jgi:hypothetical protein